MLGGSIFQYGLVYRAGKGKLEIGVLGVSHIREVLVGERLEYGRGYLGIAGFRVVAVPEIAHHPASVFGFEVGKSYREGTGVDIYKKATGYVVGYNQAGEWLEYTVNVKEAGDYTFFAAVASANATSGFNMTLDGKELTGDISVPKNDGEENYDDYNNDYNNDLKRRLQPS